MLYRDFGCTKEAVPHRTMTSTCCLPLGDPPKIMGGQTSKPTPPICEKGYVSHNTAVESPAAVGHRIQPGATIKLDGTLNTEALARWEQAICSDPTKRLARTILSQQDIWKTLKSPKAVLADQHVFNLKVRGHLVMAEIHVHRIYSFHTRLGRSRTRKRLVGAGSSRL